MTIKELKEAITSLDDDMKIGGEGYLGEFLECWDFRVKTVEGEEIFCIEIEHPGDEPDWLAT